MSDKLYRTPKNFNELKELENTWQGLGERALTITMLLDKSMLFCTLPMLKGWGAKEATASTERMIWVEYWFTNSDGKNWAEFEFPEKYLWAVSTDDILADWHARQEAKKTALEKAKEAAEKKAKKAERAKRYREYRKLREEFSIGGTTECCGTCDFGIPYDEMGEGLVLCGNKGETRTKENVCLDWVPREEIK